MNVFDRQFLHGLLKLFPGVPMSAVVSALAATAALVEPQQAVPVEQSKHKSPPRDAHDLCNRARPVCYEAQCRNRDDLIEGVVRERQVASVPFHVSDAMRPFAGEIERAGVNVQAGYVKTCRRKATGKPAGTATYVEQACARMHVEMTAKKLEFSIADPASPWTVVPRVVLFRCHRSAVLPKCLRRSDHRECKADRMAL